MKREFKLELKIKGCETIFHDLLGKGVIASKYVVFTPKNGKTPDNTDLMISILDEEKDMIEECIEFIITEVK